MNPSTSGGGESRDTPPRSYRLTQDLAEELGLSEGQILRTRVVQRLSDEDKILLNVKGQNVLAQTEINVQSGDSLIVRVNSVNHPIELSIYDPEQIGETLPENRLSDLLDRMGFPRSEELFHLARNLIERRVYLHPDLIRSARECWDDLTGSEGEIDPSRMDAFLFLYRNGLPRSGEGLERLGSHPGENRPEDWRAVLEEAVDEGEEFLLDPPVTASDLKRVLQRLGVDLIRQFGRRPHRASKTLHARLLDTDASGESWNSLLSQLLGLALCNLASDEPRQLVYPFREHSNQAVSLLELSWHPGGSTPGSPGTFRGSLSGRLEMSGLGDVEFQLQPRGDGTSSFDLRLLSNRPETFDRLRNGSERLRKNLEKLGLAVTIQVEQGSPQSPVLFRGREVTDSPMTGGGVNLLA